MNETTRILLEKNLTMQKNKHAAKKQHALDVFISIFERAIRKLNTPRTKWFWELSKKIREGSPKKFGEEGWNEIYYNALFQQAMARVLSQGILLEQAPITIAQIDILYCHTTT